MCHKEGSLEKTVENLLKTWEMERSHKVDGYQHLSVDADDFEMSANGGRVFQNDEASRVGNYNILMSTCPKDVHDAKNMTWEESHEKFHNAFAAFPFEVLEVFSPLPMVSFSWRHWGTFTGTYEDNVGQGEFCGTLWFWYC